MSTSTDVCAYENMEWAVQQLMSQYAMDESESEGYDPVGFEAAVRAIFSSEAFYEACTDTVGPCTEYLLLCAYLRDNLDPVVYQYWTNTVGVPRWLEAFQTALTEYVSGVWCPCPVNAP
jgi:hypothetical protein